MIKKIAYFVTFLCAILFVNSLYAMYNNNNGKRNYTEEQNQENAKRAKYDDADQSNLNAPTIEKGNDVFVFDKDVTQSLQVNTFAKSLIFKVYPSEDQLTKIGLKFPNVQKIDISDILRDVSSDRKKKFLRELLNFQALKELICNNNMLTDIELSILPTFTHASNNDNWLKSIHLNQNLITDKGAKNIAFRGRKLTELSITHNQIEESGALSIVKMPQLKKLSLDKNLISDESWHNIQKIATEKNLIFIENKEDFFKQTFTDNVVLNNEPKIQQTLIQNFTPVLPLNLQQVQVQNVTPNPQISMPNNYAHQVNLQHNNSNNVQNVQRMLPQNMTPNAKTPTSNNSMSQVNAQQHNSNNFENKKEKENPKNNAYIFDLEAKRKINSGDRLKVEHINTIIFKIIPSFEELYCIKGYYKDIHKIDMSVLFGNNFSNIHRVIKNTPRSLLADLEGFLMLKYEDADFKQFIENSHDQEPQKPFNFEKSRLYAERELFRKKDIRNVFVNALFVGSKNSNNQIAASQKPNNDSTQVNGQQHNSNIGQNVEQRQNQNVVFDQQMPIQNSTSNILSVSEEENTNDADYKDFLDLFYCEDIENAVFTPLEDTIFSFGNNERMLLQQGKPIFLERKINFLHFEICPTENEVFQLFQNFNYIEKINISFVLPKDKIERIKILTALKIFQHLKELIAEGNELTDEDIKCIAQELPGLTSLNLDNNLIGDNGAGSVLHMQNLKKLSVKSNKIKDKGVSEIAIMDNLEVFYYDNNEISPLGRKDIEEIREFMLLSNSSK